MRGRQCGGRCRNYACDWIPAWTACVTRLSVVCSQHLKTPYALAAQLSRNCPTPANPQTQTHTTHVEVALLASLHADLAPATQHRQLRDSGQP